MMIQIVKSIEVCGVRLDSLDKARKTMVDSCEQMIGKPLTSLQPLEYTELIKQLDTLGFFSLRGAASYLARRIGVSKVTIYNAIKRNNN